MTDQLATSVSRDTEVPDDLGMLRCDCQHLERKAETQRRCLDDTLARLARVRRQLFQAEVAQAESTPTAEF